MGYGFSCNLGNLAKASDEFDGGVADVLLGMSDDVPGAALRFVVNDAG
jgi:hypothetical protein